MYRTSETEFFLQSFLDSLFDGTTIHIGPLLYIDNIIYYDNPPGIEPLKRGSFCTRFCYLIRHIFRFVVHAALSTANESHGWREKSQPNVLI